MLTRKHFDGKTLYSFFAGNHKKRERYLASFSDFDKAREYLIRITTEKGFDDGDEDFLEKNNIYYFENDLNSYVVNVWDWVWIRPNEKTKTLVNLGVEEKCIPPKEDWGKLLIEEDDFANLSLTFDFPCKYWKENDEIRVQGKKYDVKNNLLYLQKQIENHLDYLELKNQCHKT